MEKHGCSFAFVVLASLTLWSLYVAHQESMHCASGGSYQRDNPFPPGSEEGSSASASDKNNKTIIHDSTSKNKDSNTVHHPPPSPLQSTKAEDSAQAHERAVARWMMNHKRNVTQTGAWVVDENYTYFLDNNVVSHLRSFFSGQTVLELGAGKGHYTRVLEETAKAIHAYDGVSNIEELSGGKVKHADLTNRLQLGVHDWVMCLEVGEHVPQEFELQVIDNFHRHNSKGLVISWAIPGQDGFHHVNNRPNRYIKGLFKALGYRSNEEFEKELRSTASAPHLRKTIMVLEKVA